MFLFFLLFFIIIFYLFSCRLSAVPSTKEAQCKRHATRLGLFNVINIDAGEVISESDKESLSENGNSSGSSSVSNSSNNSDISNNSSGSNNKNNSSSSSSSSAKALTLTKAQIQANLAKLKRLKSLDDYQNQTEPKRTCTIGTRYRGSRTNTKNPTEKELRDRGEVLYDWCSDYTDLSIAIRPKTQKSLNIQKSIKNSPNKNSPKNNCTNKNNGSSIDYAVIIDDDNSDIEKFPSNVISAIS